MQQAAVKTDDLFVTITSPDGQISLEVCPSVGGGITKFTCLDKGGIERHLFRPYDRNEELSPLNFSSFPLTPFSNRIGYGKLSFEGKTYDIKTPFKSLAHPNHGDGWMSVWTVEEQTAHKIVLTLEKNEDPYSYKARQTLSLENGQLVMDIDLTNNSGTALPFGTGHHPYFPRTEQTMLKVNAPRVWLSETMLPKELVSVPQKWDFSKGATFDGARLSPPAAGDDGSAYIDHCFQDWDQTAEITWPEYGVKLVMTADPVFENFVLFVPSKADFFCAEPVTNVTDGFNLRAKGVKNTGTVILDQGQTLSGQVQFKPSLL